MKKIILFYIALILLIICVKVIRDQADKKVKEVYYTVPEVKINNTDTIYIIENKDFDNGMYKYYRIQITPSKGCEASLDKITWISRDTIIN